MTDYSQLWLEIAQDVFADLGPSQQSEIQALCEQIKTIKGVGDQSAIEILSAIGRAMITDAGLAQLAQRTK